MLLVLAGLAAVGFVAGRIFAPQPDGGKGQFKMAVRVGGDFAASRDGAASTRSSGKLPPVKSATELRDELKKLRESPRIGLKSLKEWVSLLERLDASNTAALIRDYAQETLTPGDMHGLRALFDAMAEKDPDAAWNLALTLQPPMKNSALQAAMTALAKNFPDAALAKLDGIASPTLRHSLRSSVLQTIAQNDPQRAIALLEDAPEARKNSLVSTVFFNWARRDMQAAQAGLAGLDGDLRKRAMNAITHAITETDPAAAWKFATEDTSDSKDTNYYSIISRWAQIDPEAALEAASTLEDKRNREQLLSTAFATWAYADYEAAFQHVMDLSDPVVLASGISALADIPGTNSAALFDALLDRVPVGEQFNRIVDSLIRQWTSDNPREVAAALGQLPPGQTLSDAIVQFASQWYEEADDKNEPLQWALAMPSGETRSNALERIFDEWAGKDPIAAMTAAMKLPDEESKDDIVNSIASIWGNKDPQAVIKWASQLPEGEQRKEIIEGALGTVAGNDPRKAIEMLNSLGLSGDADATGRIVSRWVDNDVDAASAWIKALPDGEARNNSLKTVADHFAGDDPETAIEWAQIITDSESRTSALKSVARTWRRHDTEAALAWVASSNLPEDFKTSFANGTDKPESTCRCGKCDK